MNQPPPPLATPRCSRCRVAVGIFLPKVSSQTVVDYYFCEFCGHVWTEAKSPPAGSKQNASISSSMRMRSHERLTRRRK